MSNEIWYNNGVRCNPEDDKAWYCDETGTYRWFIDDKLLTQEEIDRVDPRKCVECGKPSVSMIEGEPWCGDEDCVEMCQNCFNLVFQTYTGAQEKDLCHKCLFGLENLCKEKIYLSHEQFVSIAEECQNTVFSEEEKQILIMVIKRYQDEIYEESLKQAQKEKLDYKNDRRLKDIIKAKVDEKIEEYFEGVGSIMKSLTKDKGDAVMCTAMEADMLLQHIHRTSIGRDQSESVVPYAMKAVKALKQDCENVLSMSKRFMEALETGLADDIKAFDKRNDMDPDRQKLCRNLMGILVERIEAFKTEFKD